MPGIETFAGDPAGCRDHGGVLPDRCRRRRQGLAFVQEYIDNSLRQIDVNDSDEQCTIAWTEALSLRLVDCYFVSDGFSLAVHLEGGGYTNVVRRSGPNRFAQTTDFDIFLQSTGKYSYFSSAPDGPEYRADYDIQGALTSVCAFTGDLASDGGPEYLPVPVN